MRISDWSSDVCSSDLVDVRRAGADWRIIAARLDRGQLPAAVAAGMDRGIALEIGIERHDCRVLRVGIAACCIGLPDVEPGTADRLSVAIEHASVYLYDLPLGALRMSGDARQIGVSFTAIAGREKRPKRRFRGYRLCQCCLGRNCADQRAADNTTPRQFIQDECPDQTKPEERRVEKDGV